MEKFYVYIKYLNNCAIVCVMKYLNSCMNAANVHTKFLCQYQRVVYFISWTNGIIREIEVLVNGIFEGWSFAVCWVYLNIPSHSPPMKLEATRKYLFFLSNQNASYVFYILKLTPNKFINKLSNNKKWIISSRTFILIFLRWVDVNIYCINF